ncbi:hypothetical protein [Rhizobium tropici]|uniref:Glycosyltransferase family 4 protein n=1 Tax=Rhizobium tropici TaxID=398 RepID=A0A329YEM0_RHITR|nr:hypothetical protein [Rhizobium tropici]RAX41987.1 hypothetical protein DQ393_10425 [Rhizobium tropici]
MPATRTILILSTYPIVEPKHGGQVRLLNIKKAYEKAGWDVVTIAVYPEESYSKAVAGDNDIPFPAHSPYRFFEGRNIPFVTDLVTGNFAAAEDGAWPDLLKRLPARLDAIHVEQPWLWPAAVKLKTMPGYASALMIYGSQNIEEPLKRDIFRDFGVTAGDALETLQSLEVEAARSADIAVAVTQEEVDVLKSWGVDEAVLVPNGIASWDADPGALAEWREKLPKYPWLLYVASAHPPNFTGLAQVFGSSLACFPPQCRLVIAGGVTEHAYRVLNETRWSELNLSRMQLLFTLSDRDLAAVKSLAHGFVLPIPFGGGSNIKTAEALYSGAYVVGTPQALRGFETFSDLHEVYIGQDVKGFQKAIRNVLSLPPKMPLEKNSPPFERRRSLLWEVRLEQLTKVVENAMTKKVRSGQDLV